MNHVNAPPVWWRRAAIAGRVCAIACVCASHGMRWAAAQVRLRRGASDFAERLTALLEDLGPTFIKSGQILSVRPDIATPRLSSALARLRDQVRPIPAAAIERVIAQSFGAPPDTMFSNFDPVPVAAGSIAQVHRATLADGRIVAVKVRRPDAPRQVELDFAVLAAAGRCLALIPVFRHTPITELIDEFATAVRQQLDFTLEAENHRRLRNIFEHSEQLSIPSLIDPLCTESVLTMDYVDGLRDVVDTQRPLPARRQTALAGLRALYRMIFEVGLVHADMHPGNVALASDGKLVLLDMGLVARLSLRDRNDFVDFFFGLVTAKGEECARIVIANASALGQRYDEALFRAAMCELVSRHARRRSAEFEIATFVAELLAVQRRYDVRGSPAFITTVLAMVVYDGICKQLYPECDFQLEARGFLIVARYGRCRSSAAN